MLVVQEKSADKTEPTHSEETEELLDSIENEGLTYFPNDYVYVDDSSAQDGDKHIMRIEQIIRDREDKEVVLVKGCWCYKPGQTYHKASRMFYLKVVIAVASAK
jgi:hypothetical protein